ncbi:18415_t:CDS:2 [Racocetra persica]|uniref:18415_t:CDS:1 n=1 Tax=Racocetra persica TaxID=160502 RepID=A0ACA9LSX1_9GLOM|nr:18415_t:CDS:2 [Racocetra persica]
MPPTNQFQDSDESWSTSSVEERLELSQNKRAGKRGKISIIACDRCRHMKKKCTGGDFVSKKPCLYCSKNGGKCVYTDLRRRRTANVQDFQQFIDRLMVIEDQLKNLISDLKEFFESTKNQEEPEFFGDEFRFEIMNFCNKSSYDFEDQKSLEDPSNPSSALLSEPKEQSDDEGISENFQFQPPTPPIPTPPINQYDQNPMIADGNSFCFNNLNLQAEPQIPPFSSEYLACDNVNDFFLNNTEFNFESPLFFNM